LSHDQFNHLCSNEGKIIRTQVLPHEAEQDTTCLNALCPCCGRKAWAANAQSFTLWQQATIEITRSLLSSPFLKKTRF